LADMLSIRYEEKYAAPRLPPASRKKKTLEILMQSLLQLAKKQIVVVIVEDLHWADPSTLEWLDLCVEQSPTHPIFVLCSSRPDFHPGWLNRSHVTQLNLQRLSADKIETICRHLSNEKSLPPEVLEQIKTKTEGVPLFVEELTRMVLESGLLKETAGAFVLTGPLPPLAIPSTLQDSLMARLDKMSPVKDLAQIGAVLGKSFSFQLLEAVSGRQAERLEADLSQLVEAELLSRQGFPPKAVFTFRHALVRDTAYESLLKSRRQQLHQRVAQVLENEFPEDAPPEILAYHLTEAGLAEAASEKWEAAGLAAQRNYSNPEAILHFKKAIEQLAALPENETLIDRKINCLLHLTTSIAFQHSFTIPEVRQYAAQLLAYHPEQHQIAQHFFALSYISVHHRLRAEYAAATVFSRQLAAYIEQTDSTWLLFDAYAEMAQNSYLTGRYLEAKDYADASLRVYNPDYKELASAQGWGEVVDFLYCYRSSALFPMGYPEQTLSDLKQAVEIADASGHPFAICTTQWISSAIGFMLTKDRGLLEKGSGTIIRVAKENASFFWLNGGNFIRHWADAVQGQAEAVETAYVNFQESQQSGFKSYLLMYSAILLDLCLQYRKSELAENIIAAALGHAEQSGEGYFKSEIYRFQGEFFVQKNQTAEAEKAYLQALQIAREQSAKWHELLAAKSLARLWMSDGKAAKAHDLLSGVYDWFTEGFELPDLREAKALIEQY
jgi:tetratricopeptide (TPR) repeat protein